MEQRKAAGSSAGEQGRAGEQGGVQGRATEQGSRAGEQGKVAGQGRGAGQQGRARQQGRAASEIQFANGRRGANICQKKMLTFSRVFEHWQKSICKRPQRGRIFVKQHVHFLTSL